MTAIQDREGKSSRNKNMGQDSWDRKAWAEQPEKTVKMMQAVQEKEDRMARQVRLTGNMTASTPRGRKRRIKTSSARGRGILYEPQ
jgi:hypothetical protein